MTQMGILGVKIESRKKGKKVCLTKLFYPDYLSYKK
jgi:hypothetical protein